MELTRLCQINKGGRKYPPSFFFINIATLIGIGQAPRVLCSAAYRTRDGGQVGFNKKFAISLLTSYYNELQTAPTSLGKMAVTL